MLPFLGQISLFTQQRSPAKFYFRVGRRHRLIPFSVHSEFLFQCIFRQDMWKPLSPSRLELGMIGDIPVFGLYHPWEQGLPWQGRLPSRTELKRPFSAFQRNDDVRNFYFPVFPSENPVNMDKLSPSFLGVGKYYVVSCKFLHCIFLHCIFTYCLHFFPLFACPEEKPWFFLNKFSFLLQMFRSKMFMQWASLELSLAAA